MGSGIFMRVSLPGWRWNSIILRLLYSVSLVSLAFPACHTFNTDRIMYDHQGVQIGLQSDPSVQRSSSGAQNSHPISLTTQELLSLMGALRVSGWSGTIVGYFDMPRSIPLFDEADLRAIATPTAEAFRQAGPMERVFFFLPNSKSAYGDATTGALFFRGPYLHVVVTDHKSFARADTAGGDEKDVRDTKGMKLGIAAPHQASTLLPYEEPAWAPFESVHLSFKFQELLAQTSVRGDRTERKDSSGPVSGGASMYSGRPNESTQEFQLQIRELTQSNLDLRDRLSQQSQELQELRDELARLRRQAEGGKQKRPPIRTPVTP